MQYRMLTECEAVFLTQIFSIPEYDLYFAENDTTEDDWKERLKFYETEHSYIISKDNADIGWIMYTICDNICKLDIVVLLSEERNKGYGKEIFKDLFVLNPQVRTIMLDVQQRNEQAVNFYKKIGFQITGEENQFVNGKNVPYFNMVLDL
ncbi:MAG: GNAT family N-acetyltransferase [Ruminococcus sp.]|nr:GNAT family N-acetyltransferase [Ruminococcus sp.]